MTIFLSAPDIDTRQSFAGGEASLGDIFMASLDQMRFVDNTFSAEEALDQAVAARIDEVAAITGVRLDPPLGRQKVGPAAWAPGRPYAEDMADFETRIAEASANIPDRAVAERLNRSVEADAIHIARQADENMARLAGSRDGIGKWAALLAGGVAGGMRDPLQVGALALGGGPGAARTVAGRVLTVAAKEALINGAVEAAIQPRVQAWREQAGLDHGFDEAMRNVLFAALTGGALGGIGAGAAEALRPLLRASDVERAAAVAAADDRVKPQLREALAGDGLKAADDMARIRDALPPAARGALDEADKLRHLELSRPAGGGAEHHDVMAARAEASAVSAEPFRFEADPQRVRRIADELMPPAFAEATAGKPQSLVEFLKSRGGVIEDNGELAAIGAEALTRRGRSAGPRDRRVPLDSAREAAEEAGYIGRPGETQVTTVRDLLDAIDQELRGRPVYAREDASTLRQAQDVDAERARVESLVSEILQFAGPAADDATARRIAELAGREGLDAATATERVLMGDEGNTPPTLREATALRQAQDEGGIGELPEPAKFDEDFELTDADLDALEAEGLEIPFFDDGSTSSAQAIREELQHMKDREAVAAACRAT